MFSIQSRKHHTVCVTGSPTRIVRHRHIITQWTRFIYINQQLCFNSHLPSNLGLVILLLVLAPLVLELNLLGLIAHKTYICLRWFPVNNVIGVVELWEEILCFINIASFGRNKYIWHSKSIRIFSPNGFKPIIQPPWYARISVGGASVDIFLDLWTICTLDVSGALLYSQPVVLCLCMMIPLVLWVVPLPDRVSFPQ